MGGLPMRGSVSGFAVDPVEPRRMWTAGPEGLFVSVDGGERWRGAGPGLAEVAAVAVSPTRRGEVYAATGGGGIYRSADGGLTWQRR